MAYQMTCEEMLPWFGFKKAECDIYEESPTWNPTTIIRRDQRWGVRFNWETVGALNYLIAGQWQLHVYLEKMGGGEYELPRASKTVRFESRPYSYKNIDIEVNAHVVPTGLYKLTAALILNGPTGVPGPVAAFAEGPMVHFYDAGPISVPPGPIPTPVR